MKMQLRTKWTVALLVTGAVPLALFSATTLGIQKRGLETAERHLEVAVIDHVGSVVDRTLDDAAEATHRVGRVLTEGSIGSDDARLELARESLARSDALAQVAIYDGTGKLIDAINKVGVVAPSPLATASVSERSWLAPVFGDGAPTLRYAEAITRDGELRAYVIGTLRGDALSEQLRGISADRFDGRPDGVLLLDESTRVIAGERPGASLRGKDLFANVQLPEGSFG
jgi:hypothetical protein